MTPQELKSSILQLAIQGKLVEQRADEGTGRELLEKILAAKNAEGGKKAGVKSHAKSAKSAKVGSCVSREEIPDDEKPFDIPESWEWVRLGEVLRVIGGVSYDKKDVTTNGYRILRGGNIQSMKVLLADEDVFLPEQYRDEEKIVCVGDILIVASTGSKTVIGKAGYVDRNIPNTMIGAFLRICRPYSYQLADYFRLVFESDFYRKHIRDLAQGTNINNVKESYITQFAIPLPPLAEQKRIVAKIEELLPLVERYEKAWSKLKDFNKRFPADMQKSLLQMAIQGKLVEQRAEEGTGKELLEEILAAKNAEGAKGKGEKCHAKSAKSAKVGSRVSRDEIPDDEKSFDIPDSWEWVMLGEVGSWSAGATPSRTRPDYYGGNIPWLKTGDLNDGYVAEIPETITELALAKTSVRLNPVGSVLMAMYGATIGKLGILKVPATTNQACCACIPFSGIYNKYLFYFLKGYRKSFIKMGEGGAQPNISKEKIVRTLIPLPPLAEQKRIVAKLEELLPLCERLK